MYCVLLGLVLVCTFVHGTPIINSLSRSKRQTADLWMDHLKTLLALNTERPDYTRCGDIIGCGLLDVVNSGKKKRSSSISQEDFPSNSRKIQQLQNLQSLFGLFNAKTIQTDNVKTALERPSSDVHNS